jgi:hypothetical protein
VTTYLIPTQQFCDRLLTFCTNHYRVIGYPVCIREGKYSRNEFIFNFALVVEDAVADWVAYGEVVRKLGRLLRGLEEQGGFVSGEEEGMGVWEDEGGLGIRGTDEEGMLGGGSKVYALCEMVLEDLNNYAECMIPIGTRSSHRSLFRPTLIRTRRLQHDKSQALPNPSTSPPGPRGGGGAHTQSPSSPSPSPPCPPPSPPT